VPSDVFISYSTKYDYIGDVHGEPKDDAQAAMMEEVERETYAKVVGILLTKFVRTRT